MPCRLELWGDREQVTILPNTLASLVQYVIARVVDMVHKYCSLGPDHLSPARRASVSDF